MTQHHAFKLGLSIALVAAIVGCAAQQTEPTARSEWPEKPQPTSPVQHDPVAGPTPFAFFGDDPAYDAVPFENHTIGNMSRHTFTSDGLDFDPDIDATGEELAYASTRNAHRPDIYIKHVDGTTLQQLTSDPADDVQPQFSPDGKQIAFCSNRTGNWDLWVINRDGTGLQQLTHTIADEISPTWSPDGSQIAFSMWSPQGRRWEVWSLVVDQPGVRKFLTYGMFPAWSPDGEKIALQRARQRGSRWFSVWTIDLVDGEARMPTEVAQSPVAACIAPQWSPDGKHLVYCTVAGVVPPAPAPEAQEQTAEGPVEPQPPSMETALWIVNVDNGMRYKLEDAGGPSFNPTWSSTNRVYFVSSRAGAENIWSLNSGLSDVASSSGDGRSLSRTGETPPAARK